MTELLLYSLLPTIGLIRLCIVLPRHVARLLRVSHRLKGGVLFEALGSTIGALGGLAAASTAVATANCNRNRNEHSAPNGNENRSRTHVHLELLKETHVLKELLIITFVTASTLLLNLFWIPYSFCARILFRIIKNIRTVPRPNHTMQYGVLTLTGGPPQGGAGWPWPPPPNLPSPQFLENPNKINSDVCTCPPIICPLPSAL